MKTFDAIKLKNGDEEERERFFRLLDKHSLGRPVDLDINVIPEPIILVKGDTEYPNAAARALL